MAACQTGMVCAKIVQEYPYGEILVQYVEAENINIAATLPPAGVDGEEFSNGCTASN
jgi:hypothetical protein